jgi:hypothetical protein
MNRRVNIKNKKKKLTIIKKMKEIFEVRKKKEEKIDESKGEKAEIKMNDIDNDNDKHKHENV